MVPDSRQNMIENERKILHIIAKRNGMTKKEIADSLNLSWATVVKITKRLEQNGFIKFQGRPERKNIQGVDSAVFALSSNNPTAIGIDMGYNETNIIITNLSNEILYHKLVPNPTLESIDDITGFLETCITETLEDKSGDWVIQGVGVGIPAFILPDKRDFYIKIRKTLNEKFRIPVHIDRNVRGYALYKRFQHNREGNYIVLTIRTGIGLGIILNDGLFRGESNMAGELSHTTVPGLEGVCRCGQTGCLETGLNYAVLSEDYRGMALKSGLPGDVPYPPTELMKLSSEGNLPALDILKKRSRILAQAIKPLLLILNVSRITVAGQFGEYGQVFTDLVNEALSEMLSLRIDHAISYEKLDLLDFAIGSSYLILEDFIS